MTYEGRPKKYVNMQNKMTILFSGPLFTWYNKQAANPILKKLDKVINNHRWIASFLDYKVEFLSPGVSNYCAGFIKCYASIATLPKPFRFFNFWAQYADFLSIVAKV